MVFRTGALFVCIFLPTREGKPRQEATGGKRGLGQERPRWTTCFDVLALESECPMETRGMNTPGAISTVLFVVMPVAVAAMAQAAMATVAMSCVIILIMVPSQTVAFRQLARRRSNARGVRTTR